MKKVVVVLVIGALIFGALATLGWIIAKAIEVDGQESRLPEVGLRPGQLAVLRPSDE